MDPEDRERQLGETRSLRELRQQLETLASAGARRRARPRRLVLALVAGVAVAIVLGGVALAGGFDGLLVGPSHRPPPKVLQVTPLDGSPLPSPTPYPTNAAGQTYGGAQATAEADLQAVSADRGENGYCWTSDLNGPMPITGRRPHGSTAVSEGSSRLTLPLIARGGPSPSTKPTASRR